MNYKLSVNQFSSAFLTDDGNKIIHKHCNRFKLFPFIGNNNIPAVTDLSAVIGRFLCGTEGLTQTGIDLNTVYNRILSVTEVELGKEQIFYELIKQMFFSDGQIRPLNLKFLEHITCSESSEKKIADYLVDVLGNKEVLNKEIKKANQKLEQSCNVFERLFLSSLESENPISEVDTPYFRVINSFETLFEEDFSYILANQNRVREYLITLLEFYFFTYTAQVSMELDRFMNGSREHVSPLYFSLEWEKTSQSRKCFTDSWQKLQSSLEKIFAHAVTLELLNQTEEGEAPVDYILLRELSSISIDEDARISKEIDNITKKYREAIKDCPEMNELTKSDLADGETATSIRYLFDSVKSQFENTSRKRVYDSYSQKFQSFCYKYLKKRGRSGYMLNITDETLIFLTKICIKDRDQMRLKDVFEEFQKRGVFLDEYSKDQATAYYERLNLIEKKSDSGDAKYVKRIL